MMCYPGLISTSRNGLDTPLSAELLRRREAQIAAAEFDRYWESLPPEEAQRDMIQAEHYRGQG